MLDWALLLNKERRRPTASPASVRKEGRTEFERDYDRLLFSAPIRRMADKTQVFPLEARDGIRTRLTHSHEVSSLARSIGVDLVDRFASRVGIQPNETSLRDVSALLAATGLVHDIGNPPFGHQGERAIAGWFRKNYGLVFDQECGVPEDMQEDFLKFDGNAQALRLVARLQYQGDEFGLNLTFGTLATLLKYPVLAAAADPDSRIAGLKKQGFFHSELAIVEEVWRKTGLQRGQRHPLTYVMEACDDIAYSTIDLEDTVRKDLASYADVRDYLLTAQYDHRTVEGDALVASVFGFADARREVIKRVSLSSAELDDLSMQVWRVAAISAMVKSALDAFVQHYSAIAQGIFEGDLLANSPASQFRDLCKNLLRRVTFPHRSVLEIELRGSIVIEQLMDRLWAAIAGREDRAQTQSRPVDPRLAYTYSRLSENYRIVFETASTALPMRYREAQLMTDMIAGMTDSYAMALLADLTKFDQ
jgi:dGTPase